MIDKSLSYYVPFVCYRPLWHDIKFAGFIRSVVSINDNQNLIFHNNSRATVEWSLYILGNILILVINVVFSLENVYIELISSALFKF